MAAAFETSDTAVIGGILQGMGGVGKTQLAIDFAHTAWERGELDLCVWVDATSRDSIVSTLAEAAARVGHGDNSNPEYAAKRFINWLQETSKKWLIVFDDLAEPTDLAAFRPPHRHAGRTVITTRRRDASLRAKGYAWVPVDLYTKDQALNYLRDRLRHDPRVLAGAEDLVDALKCLPLALAQASAVIIDDPRMTCRTYLSMFNDRGRTLTGPARSEGWIDGYRDELWNAWNISIDRSENVSGSRLPRSLMEILSLLDPNGVPENLLSSPAVCAHTDPGTADQITAALAALHRMSLIEFAGSERLLVRVHDVVQWSVRETATAGLDQAALAVAVADGLMSIWPEGNRDSEEARLVRGNAAFLLNREAAQVLYPPTLHPLQFKLGDSYGRIGQTSKALVHFEKLLGSAQDELGSDHCDTLRARHQYAYWLGFAGKVGEAWSEFRRLAEDQTRVLGPDHPDTLDSRHNVARFRGRSGNPEDAVELLEALIPDRARELGPEHVDTLTSRNILGYWLGKAGRAESGIRELEELLEIRLRVVGPDDDGTLTTRNDLALCRGEAGDVAGAVRELEQLVPHRVEILGARDPAAMSSRSYLAHWRCKLGQTSRAIEELISVLADHETVLGMSHPSSLRTANYLAAAYAESGDYVRAVGVLEEILPVQRVVLEPDHPNTLQTERNIDAWRKHGEGEA